MSRIRWRDTIALALVLVTGVAGCGSLGGNAIGVNPRRLPRELLGTPRADQETINLALLRQDRPEVYRLAARDVLGIFIEGVLGQPDEPPPVDIPVEGDLPPSIGFPFPVREDGTLSLPLIEDPVKVEGLTVAETETLIREEYTQNRNILDPEKARIIVTLARKRTYQVLVIREDATAPTVTRTASRDVPVSTKRGTGFALDLVAYENDVLHALTETGGLPGVDAKAEIIVLRNKFEDAKRRAEVVAKLERNLDPCEPLPQHPPDPNVVRIPLRLSPGVAPKFNEEDIILSTGDIVYITSRDADVFYTGGILRGDEIPLPRDYDLDILGAIALAGGAIGGGGLQFAPGYGVGGVGGIGRGSLQYGVLPPTRATIVRKTPPYGEVSIKLDLYKALTDPAERVLIQPGDIVILGYKPSEAFMNLVLSTFNFTRMFDQLFFR